MSALDNLEKIKEIDQQNLSKIMKDLPYQLEKVWQEREKIKLKIDKKKIKNLVLVGMGCDRLTAELIKKIMNQKSTIPVETISDYQIPNFVNEETLIIFLSYSGNTLEVIETIKTALTKKTNIFAISGGGELNKIIEKYNLPHYQFKSRGPSRANLGYLFCPILILLSKLELIKFEKKEFFNLLKLLIEFNKLNSPKEKTERNVAKYLAYQIYDRVPFIVGAQHLTPIAKRWKNEINENAKTFAFAEEMPEFFHAAAVGIDFPMTAADNFFFLFLESNLYKRKIKKAMILFQEILKEKKICFERVPVVGKTILAEMMTGLLLGDWVSFYLAILNNIDPTPVKNIEIIKKRLRYG